MPARTPEAPRRPRVLIVCGDPADFLASREPWARRARERGYEVHVALPGASDRGAVEARWPVHPYFYRRGSLRPDHLARTAWSLWRTYRRVRPDVAQHVQAPVVVVGTLAALLARVRGVVNTVGGLGIAYTGSGVRTRLLRAAYGVGYRLAFTHPRQWLTVQNTEDARELARHGAKPEWTRVVPGSGVDLERFAARPREAGAPVTVVMVSRLLWSKGVGEYVAAAGVLAGTGARFLLVGEPDPVNPDSVPAAQVEAWARAGDVEYLGRRDDMPDVLARADVVCLPTAYREGIPRIVLEAAAAGRPVVTTTIPGCAEAVEDGVTGLLVPPRDVAALAAALQRLIDDPAGRASMGAAARARAEREFSIEHLADVMVDLYDALSAPPARPARRSFRLA